MAELIPSLHAIAIMMMIFIMGTALLFMIIVHHWGMTCLSCFISLLCLLPLVHFVRRSLRVALSLYLRMGPFEVALASSLSLLSVPFRPGYYLHWIGVLSIQRDADIADDELVSI